MHLPCARSSATVVNRARATNTSNPDVASSKINTGGSCTIAPCDRNLLLHAGRHLGPPARHGSRSSATVRRFAPCGRRVGRQARPCSLPKVTDHLPGPSCGRRRRCFPRRIRSGAAPATIVWTTSKPATVAVPAVGRSIVLRIRQRRCLTGTVGTQHGRKSVRWQRPTRRRPRRLCDHAPGRRSIS